MANVRVEDQTPFIYMTSTELCDYDGDFTFENQTRADADGNYETEWILDDGQLVRVKQNLYDVIPSLEK